MLPAILEKEQTKLAVKPRTLRFIDLFAGIGGTRLAFESAGMRCVFSSEWDPFAQQTYEANFGEKPNGDITKVDPASIPLFDVLVGGFPCQPFSSIGKRQGFEHKTQGTLFFDVAQILKQKTPAAVLLENVKGLVNHDKGRTWRVIQETLNELGYSVHSAVLDAANYGVPQHRERIYIVGFRSESAFNRFDFPKPRRTKVGIGSFIQSGVEDRSISKHLQGSYIFKIDDGRPEIVDRSTAGQVKTLVASYHKIQRLTGTFVRDGSTGLRLLTEQECKAIMGFPSNFVVPVSRTQMYRQFGNSVAVPVVSAIAKKMASALGASGA